MDRETARQEIRSRIKCTDYLEKSKHGFYCCPQLDCRSGHGANGTGAVKYYPETNTYHCHACKRGGDVIDLYQLTTGADYNTALSALAREIGIEIDAGRKNGPAEWRRSDSNGKGNIETTPAEENATERVKSGVADYLAYYQECRARITDPKAVAYLQGRGISQKTAAAYWIGYDPAADPANAPGAGADEYKPHPCPRIIIPCSMAYYVGRRIDGGKAYKAPNPKGSTTELFNGGALYAQDVQEVFITEGAFDALSIIEAGAAAVAMNGAGNGKILLAQLEQRRTDATLILCPDNDPDPNTAARVTKEFEALAEGLQRLEIKYITADINGGCKDANEALTADSGAFVNAVQDAITQARKSAEQLQQEAQAAERERQQRTGAGMIDAFLEAIRTKKYEPVPTGITDIDNAIGGGFMRQQIILLGAAPGAGKTSLAQWIFEGMAKRGHPCVYLNLEMSRDQMLARSISRIAAQNGERIKATEVLQGYKWDAAQECIAVAAAEKYKAEIAPRMIYNPDEVTAELDSILAYIEAEAQRAEAAGMPAPCVVLDYLQIVRGREREDDTAVIKRAMAALKTFAIVHNTFVFLIMANNRAANKTGDVTMESGRDTSALEYGADLQLGLAYTHCLKKYGGKAKDELTKEELQHLTLKITKGRWGGPGVDVNLHFDGETMTYTQMAPDSLESAIPKEWKISDKRY